MFRLVVLPCFGLCWSNSSHVNLNYNVPERAGVHVAFSLGNTVPT